MYLIAGVSLLAHLAVSGNYGYFRDELYYIAAGHHPGFGYVDFPPLIAWLAAATRLTVGDSLVALHVWPAVANAILIVTTAWLARELGGGRFAQGLAALGSATSVLFLTTGSIFSMDALDQLWWALGALVVASLIARREPRWWLLFGLVAGLGLLTKITIAFFGLAIIVGCLLTPARSFLASRWLWLGGLIAALCAAPYVLWNAANGWPTVAFWTNYGSKLAGLSFSDFVFQQIYTVNPLLLPLWLAGLSYFFLAKRGQPFRVFGWAYVVLFVLFAIGHAKVYFLGPAYVPLFAGGAVAVEEQIRRQGWHWVGRVYPTVLVVVTVLLAPIGMPILPPATWVQAYSFLGGDAGAQMERHQTGLLPQWLADRFGWEGMAATVAGVYNGLTPEQRSAACIFTGNYGEAGAIDFFGPALQLPHAISGHNSYYLWGPDGCTGQVVIAIGVSPSALTPAFASVRQVGTITCQYCMPDEDNLPVLLATQPTTTSIPTLWPTTRHYN
jgi:4-amino-4-deoxy-L-arabinose transferase-like glycosyltransferase